MVIESFISPFKAEKKPFRLLLFGIIYASLGLLLGFWIFEQHAGLVMVFFTSFAALPLFYHTMKYEEKKVTYISQEKRLLEEHSKALMFFMMIFFGMVIAYSFWYLVLPSALSNSVFSIQTQTIANLNREVTGSISQTTLFSRIFLNNIKVMIFCLLFSFLYGSGAIFILTWNASVISAAIGSFIKTHLAILGANSGGIAYFYVISLSFFRYFIHGIPEILAYFIGGLAGGILSASIINHEVGTKYFEYVFHLEEGNFLK